MQTEVVKQGKSSPVKPASTAIAAAAPNALSTELRGSWGSEGVDASDVLIPRILLMQGLSKLVSAGERSTGDVIRSTTKEVLASKGTTFEIIPVLSWKSWTNFDCSGKKPEFRSIEPMTPENANAPLEFMVDGKNWRRDKTLNFYILLPQDIVKEAKAKEAILKGEFPDTDDVLLPAAISFSRSGYQTGKELATHFKKAEAFNIPPASRVFKLGTKLVSNDDGTWPIFELSKHRPSTAVELEAAKRWYDTLRTAQVRVHDEVEEVGTVAPQGDKGAF